MDYLCDGRQSPRCYPATSLKRLHFDFPPTLKVWNCGIIITEIFRTSSKISRIHKVVRSQARGLFVPSGYIYPMMSCDLVTPRT